MGRILVLYHSNSGNTQHMAALVGEGAGSIPDMEVRVLSTQEAKASDLEWCDGIAVGSPTNFGTVAWEMKRWWDTEAYDSWMRVDGKFACAFATQGGWGGGAELTCQALSTILINFGFLVFGVTDYVGKQGTLHYGAICAGEPRADWEQESCRRLGRRLAEWVACFVDGRKEFHPTLGTYSRAPEDFS
ncbi:MAG: flavodoxin family protein [Verrucomicrobiales bacterium]